MHPDRCRGFSSNAAAQWTSERRRIDLAEHRVFGVAGLGSRAVAHGVIRHRVMDVSFIISRTLVYTILTVAAVSVFSLIEYVFGKRVGTSRRRDAAGNRAADRAGTITERRASPARRLHRSRALPATAPRRTAPGERTARALPDATGADAVDAVLVDEPAEAFDLASAALFRWDDQRYRRIRSRGWSDAEATVLEWDDRLALAVAHRVGGGRSKRRAMGTRAICRPANARRSMRFRSSTATSSKRSRSMADT